MTFLNKTKQQTSELTLENHCWPSLPQGINDQRCCGRKHTQSGVGAVSMHCNPPESVCNISGTPPVGASTVVFAVDHHSRPSLFHSFAISNNVKTNIYALQASQPSLQPA